MEGVDRLNAGLFEELPNKFTPLGTVIIDACKPYRWRQHWDSMFTTCDMDEELRQRTADKWQDVLGALITAPKPI